MTTADRDYAECPACAQPTARITGPTWGCITCGATGQADQLDTADFDQAKSRFVIETGQHKMIVDGVETLTIRVTDPLTGLYLDAPLGTDPGILVWLFKGSWTARLNARLSRASLTRDQGPKE